MAILTKIVGCGLGAKMCRYSNAEALQIGCGMISRGEVALIVANKGAALGLMSTTFFGPIIITVVATTIIAPILLKLVFRSKKKADGQSAVEAEEKSPLAEGLAEIYEYSQAAKILIIIFLELSENQIEDDAENNGEHKESHDFQQNNCHVYGRIR